ncbi:MAG: hypothetical protein BGN92_13165 [Sphingobacteriales bacterium 41-5]|nr:MAG: hypothetical protein BGN92_13165 [Sphingobacteriales bacterium 41-5]
MKTIIPFDIRRSMNPADLNPEDMTPDEYSSAVAEIFMLPTAIGICLLGNDKITLRLLRDVISRVPREVDGRGGAVFEEVYAAAFAKAKEGCREYCRTIPEEEKQRLYANPTYSEDMRNLVPDWDKVKTAITLFFCDAPRLKPSVQEEIIKKCTDFLQHLEKFSMLLMLKKGSFPETDDFSEIDIELCCHTLTEYFRNRWYSKSKTKLSWKDVVEYVEINPRYQVGEFSFFTECLGYIPIFPRSCRISGNGDFNSMPFYGIKQPINREATQTKHWK